MNEFTIRFLIIGLPGIICYFLCRKLIGKREHTSLEVIMLVFVFSALSYLFLGLLEVIVRFLFRTGFDSKIIELFINPNKPVSTLLLFWAAGAGLILAYVLSYCVHYNLLNRFGQFIKATKHYGDEDVWHYFHNAPDKEKNDGWMIIRDLKTELTYYGYISAWSDSGLERELVLSDVSVYNNGGEYLYCSDNIYLSRNRDEITIEVPPENAEELKEYTDEKSVKAEPNYERESDSNEVE